MYFQIDDPDVAGAEAIRIIDCWNKDGFSLEAKRGEEMNEELKIGYLPINLKAVELI